MGSGDTTAELYKKALKQAGKGGTEQDYITRKRAQKKRAQALRKGAPKKKK